MAIFKERNKQTSRDFRKGPQPPKQPTRHKKGQCGPVSFDATAPPVASPGNSYATSAARHDAHRKYSLERLVSLKSVSALQ